MHDDGRHRNDTADGQAARVAHEDLGREGVEPQKANQCAHKSGQKDHQLLASRDKHQVEVTGCHGVTRNIGQGHQSDADDGRVARSHAVHAIVEVGTIADGRHHKHGEQHKENPC